MRAVKAIAIFCALLALGCIVGGTVVGLAFFSAAQNALGELQALPQTIAGGTISPFELEGYLQQSLSSTAVILTDTLAESRMLLFLLFGGAVVLLLITIVLLVALRPARRQDYYDYDTRY